LSPAPMTLDPYLAPILGVQVGPIGTPARAGREREVYIPI
jgi:hypothetical protein